jgi:hypothetical protein
MNIELHGFASEAAKELQERIWSMLISNLPYEERQDCVVSEIDSRPRDVNVRNAPFFRVFSDKRTDFGLACTFLKSIPMPGAGMKVFVECVLLDHCREL